MSASTPAIEAPERNSYSPALRSAAAPVNRAATANRPAEVITPASFRVSPIWPTPEPFSSTTVVRSPDFAAGPGPAQVHTPTSASRIASPRAIAMPPPAARRLSRRRLIRSA